MAKFAFSFRVPSLLTCGAVAASLLSAQVQAQATASKHPAPQLISASTAFHPAQADEAVLSPQASVFNTGLKARAIPAAPVAQGNTYSTTTIGTTNGSYFNFTFSFSSATTITSGGVYTKGASGSDFQDVGTGSCDSNGYPYTYAASATCTMVVSFTPSRAGNRQGAAVLQTSTAGTYYYGVVNGIGSGPSVTFSPATASVSTIASGVNAYNSALDGSGNLWVADSAAGTVKEYVRSNGAYPSSPTNTFTGFTTPQGITVDGIGNVYVGDGPKGYLWRLTATNGVVTPGTAPVAYVNFLAAGTQPIFVAVDPTFTYVYFTGIYSSTKYLFYCTLSSGNCGLLTTYTAPSGLTVDSAGYKYIADSSTGSVYRLPATFNSTTQTTLLTGLSTPTGLATDAAGDLYVTTQGAGTSGAGTLTEYIAQSGLVSSSSATRTLATGLYAPAGVTVSGLGNVFIADTSNNAVKYIDYQDAPTTFAFGSGTAVGSTSAAQSVTLQNVGNADLTFPVPSAGSTNPSIPSGFVVGTSSTCPYLSSASASGTLSEGATCSYAIQYQPTYAGATAGNLVITDNNLAVSGSTQSIKLTGSTTSGLTVTVVSATVPRGTASVTFSTDIGYGGTAVPTGTTTLYVNGSSSGVTSKVCTAKSVHTHCEITYTTSSLATGLYTVTVTQGSDPNYSSASGSATLNVY